MRTRRAIEGSAGESASKRSPEEPIDLRPFRAISCIGPSQSVEHFLEEFAQSVPENTEVAMLLHPTRPPFDRDGDGPTNLLHALVEIVHNLKETTRSLVVISDPAGGQLVEMLREALGPRRQRLSFSVLFRAFDEEAEAIIALSANGDRGLFVRPGRETTPASPTPVLRDGSIPFHRANCEPGIGIALLGPVEMRGTDYPLARHPKLTELVVFLALHREGATSAIWTAALWPDRRVPQQTIANRLSEARRILGLATDGRPRLRRNGERHQIVEFSSDWEDFCRLGSTDCPDQWQAALNLVRGRPFDDLSQGQWVVFEGFLAAIEREIAAVALRLGRSALSTGEADVACWAAQQALRACPFDERLHRLLMRSADALGNRAGVELALRQLALVLEIDGDPLRAVHPDTRRLYLELTTA